jgi:hypothetical protein
MAISPTLDSGVFELSVLLFLDQKTHPADFDPSPGSCGGGAASSEDAVDGVLEFKLGSTALRPALAPGVGSSARLLLVFWPD